MGESNTRRHTCLDCPRAVTRNAATGPVPKRCPQCSADHRRARQNARKARIRDEQGPSIFTCRECGMVAPLPPGVSSVNRHRCPPCSDARQRASRLERSAQRSEARAAARRGRKSSCVTCGSDFGVSHRRRASKWCPTCREEHKRTASRLANSKRPRPSRATGTIRIRDERPCDECAQPFVPFWKGTPARWCNDCQAKRARRQRLEWKRDHPDPHRIAKRGVEAELISSREIFDRDRWKCQICFRRINRRLQYPHPMCASLDHTIPVSQGGTHTRSNVRASHLRCNVSRGNRGGGEQLLLIG